MNLLLCANLTLFEMKEIRFNIFFSGFPKIDGFNNEIGINGEKNEKNIVCTILKFHRFYHNTHLIWGWLEWLPHLFMNIWIVIKL
jgi:hypothetical protein